MIVKLGGKHHLPPLLASPVAIRSSAILCIYVKVCNIANFWNQIPKMFCKYFSVANDDSKHVHKKKKVSTNSRGILHYNG